MFYVFLANGFEETEALVPLDLLRRGGVDARTVGVSGNVITGSKGVRVEADLELSEIDLSSCDGILLPGGMPGTENLFRSGEVCDAVRFCAENGKLVCSICAAPSVPGRLGLLKGKKAVCFPGFESELLGAEVGSAAVVRDGTFITARGAGCVFPFSHTIISALKDKQTADRVIAEIQYAQM